ILTSPASGGGKDTALSADGWGLTRESPCRDPLAVVEGVELRLVGGADRMAADLQGRRHLRVCQAERFFGDNETAHPLARRQLAVDPRDDVANRLVEPGMSGQRRQIAGDAMFACDCRREF